MIYYKRNEKTLETFQNKEDRDLLSYHDPLDIRNYAISIIYGNGIKESEQIIRTFNLELHYKVLSLLYKESKYFKKYIKKSNIDVIHYSLDEALVKGSNAIIYHENPDGTRNKDVGADLFLPEVLDDYIKDFLRKREIYLMQFPYMGIYQYNKEKDELIELSDNCSSEYKNVLKKLIK